MSDCQLLSELPESIEVDGPGGGNGEQAKASSGENILGICFPFIFACSVQIDWTVFGMYTFQIAKGKRGGGFESDTTRLESLP